MVVMPTEGDAPEMALADAVTLDDVRAAAARIAGLAHRTPVRTSRALNAMLGATGLVKCENEQRVGAFKFRGACNALARLTPDQRSAGVLAYSSGNHAQGVALAAGMMGVPAVIVMPADAPGVKLAATRGYGAEVVTYERGREVREEVGARLAAARGLAIVPPYDHPDVIAGQGTVGLELVEETGAEGAGPVDVLFVCVGGGGLLSGCAVAAKGLDARTRVVGVEPASADDAKRSFESGRLCVVREPMTIADGARTPCLGRYTFAMVRRHVDAMMTVTDEELREAMVFAFERMKMVVEPAGALAMAGAMRVARERPEELRGRRVGIVVSGGNIDAARFARIIQGDLTA